MGGHYAISSPGIQRGNMMQPPRRQFLHLVAGAVALPAVSQLARAQTYPTRPVRIIVGFPAGGGVDTVARLMGRWLSERFGQSFIIENRPGGREQYRGRGGCESISRWPHAPCR
jgi:hypothetical protein